ncbi:MAG TPA: glutamate-5-semialdehyde dehydrogenase [Halanaerobiales bacterium]|nr:glutamate-5-semialdehyde dehydrogenase [Halanaerobiales bacterium]
MSIREEVVSQAKLAEEASLKTANISTEVKNKALYNIAEGLMNKQSEILAANNKDMEKAREQNLSKAFLDRLSLDEDRIKGMADGLMEVAELDDPIGDILEMKKRPNGLQIGKMRVPLGVIGIIYEARPNVTVDTAALCLKSGNTVLLRGGSNAFNSNKILTEIIQANAHEAGMPAGTVQLIQTTDRAAVKELLTLNDYLDLLIPRGGAELINRVINESKIPVIQTGVGNCHIFVDETADIKKAAEIIVNAKTSRPAVCNAAESLLIHRELANDFIPRIAKVLSEYDVEIRGDDTAVKIENSIKKADESDWGKEYLDYIISLKVVDNIDHAVENINKYGTKHSEAIITEDYTNAQQFLNEVDAAAVYINASTRFTDGNQFGLGAEIGISTQKMHARGPMGLNELTSTKYVIYGQGQIRE